MLSLQNQYTTYFSLLKLLNNYTVEEPLLINFGTVLISFVTVPVSICLLDVNSQTETDVLTDVPEGSSLSVIVKREDTFAPLSAQLAIEIPQTGDAVLDSDYTMVLMTADFSATQAMIELPLEITADQVRRHLVARHWGGRHLVARHWGGRHVVARHWRGRHIVARHWRGRRGANGPWWSKLQDFACFRNISGSADAIFLTSTWCLRGQASKE